MMRPMPIPFRWDLAIPDSLGQLREGPTAPIYPEFLDNLLRLCARTMALASDADLVFVGRSPESLFDHLSGLLNDTSWRERLHLLQFSMRREAVTSVRATYPGAESAMRSYFAKLALDPLSLLRRAHPVAFVDLVGSGSTFGHLVEFLWTWAKDVRADWDSVRGKLLLRGITPEEKTSPNTWRWQQHASWVPERISLRSIKNVSAPWRLWDYLGNWQQKTTRSYHPARWGDPRVRRPSRESKSLEALRLANALHQLGRCRARREAFLSRLVGLVAMKETWYRRLTGELRSHLGHLGGGTDTSEWLGPGTPASVRRRGSD